MCHIRLACALALPVYDAGLAHPTVAYQQQLEKLVIVLANSGCLEEGCAHRRSDAWLHIVTRCGQLPGLQIV